MSKPNNFKVNSVKKKKPQTLKQLFLLLTLSIPPITLFPQLNIWHDKFIYYICAMTSSSV